MAVMDQLQSHSWPGNIRELVDLRLMGRLLPGLRYSGHASQPMSTPSLVFLWRGPKHTALPEVVWQVEWMD